MNYFVTVPYMLEQLMLRFLCRCTNIIILLALHSLYIYGIFGWGYINQCSTLVLYMHSLYFKLCLIIMFFWVYITTILNYIHFTWRQYAHTHRQHQWLTIVVIRWKLLLCSIDGLVSDYSQAKYCTKAEFLSITA